MFSDDESLEINIVLLILYVYFKNKSINSKNHFSLTVKSRIICIYRIICTILKGVNVLWLWYIFNCLHYIFHYIQRVEIILNLNSFSLGVTIYLKSVRSIRLL